MPGNTHDMLNDIQEEIRYTRDLTGKDSFDERILDAMKQVQRDAFVPDGLKHRAFDNGPLPIGHGQTISQPYIVALMTDLLAPQPEHTILEIGTGSGYQTAILSRLCKSVYTVDVISPLVKQAAERLSRLGYDNVHATAANGYQGLPEHAPYDGIIVTAAAPYIPDTLIEQLKPKGRLVIPVGMPHGSQTLMLITKDKDGHTHTNSILGVVFVPLVNTEVQTDSE